MFKKLPSIGLISLLLLGACNRNDRPDALSPSPPGMEAAHDDTHRLIVLSDIEADPDDTQSLIRLLLYSNVIDIEGLIATTSTHQRTRVAPESMKRIIHAYGQVRQNLEKHQPCFPGEEALLNLVKQGLSVYGMQGVGEGKDSEGSEWIINILGKKDDRPVWVSVWGGTNTLAQALYKIRNTKNESETKRLVDKLRVYTISDQDDSGIWIRNNFPDLFYIVSPGGYFNSTWIAITQVIPGIDNETISNSWLAKNIQQGHGPLGALYPDVAYGMEGDTPSWLSLIPNGLNVPDHPEWGGWGGRYELYQPDVSSLDTRGFTGGVSAEPETRPIWTNAVDTYAPGIYQEYGRPVRPDTLSFSDNKASLWRWRDDFQNDFAARMDWCTMSYEDANHPPVPALGHPDKITVKSGDIFSLDASGTTDPDGDNLSYYWFHYPEAGSFKDLISFAPLSDNLYNVHTIKAPEVEKTETAHFILKVTDKGKPALSRYKRVIVTIIPE
ncbi:MAG TPA: nucleoside hydrolase-like domain-containing protein [Cyclobacteriaceae bacterium]|nr:nucleoside hydrolase-like domain-containing protein [Cyclobacteriaceae bacterium]